MKPLSCILAGALALAFTALLHAAPLAGKTQQAYLKAHQVNEVVPRCFLWNESPRRPSGDRE